MLFRIVSKISRASCAASFSFRTLFISILPSLLSVVSAFPLVKMSMWGVLITIWCFLDSSSLRLALFMSRDSCLAALASNEALSEHSFTVMARG